MVMSLLLLYSMGASAAPATTRSVTPNPPVRVWFNSDGNYRYGDRAKVYAKAAEDGNLVVLRADASGQVRVLFPVDPDGDQQDRKSTRLNSSHRCISYAVFCLKKKTK